MRLRFDPGILALAGIRAVPATDQVELAWPDFDRWQAFFAARGAFPVRWEGLHVAPPAEAPEASDYRHRKLELLCEWHAMVADRTVALARYARRRMRVRITRQHAGPPCPVCDPFNAVEIEPALEPLPSLHLPPFHPGCRCLLMAADPRPARRRTVAVPGRRPAGPARRPRDELVPPLPPPPGAPAPR